MPQTAEETVEVANLIPQEREVQVPRRAGGGAKRAPLLHAQR